MECSYHLHVLHKIQAHHSRFNFKALMPSSLLSSTRTRTTKMDAGTCSLDVDRASHYGEYQILSRWTRTPTAPLPETGRLNIIFTSSCSRTMTAHLQIKLLIQEFQRLRCSLNRLLPAYIYLWHGCLNYYCAHAFNKLRLPCAKVVCLNSSPI